MKKLIEVEFIIDQESPGFGSRKIGDKMHVDSVIANTLEKRGIVKYVKTAKAKEEVKENGS